jgi:DNA-binding transcriptional ArsR family regulator
VSGPAPKRRTVPSEDRAGAVFGALSDPTRRALLAAIAEHPAATATELAAELPISRQAVLKHLGALTDAGLLDRTRSGREVRYEFTPAPLSDAVDWMTAVGAEWDDRLAVLRRQLSGAGGVAVAGGVAAAGGVTVAGGRDTARPTRRSGGTQAPPPSHRRSIPGAG